MTIDVKDLINSIMDSFDRIEHINSDDIPNMDLYVDQVTTFMDSHLRKTVRNSGDKIITKTMINNYAKNNLLPPPVKKKYSREHMLLLIFIYYYKNVISISDIQKLLNPISDRYFQSGEKFDIKSIYDEVFTFEKTEIDALKEDVMSKYREAEKCFGDAEEDMKDFLQKFAFICMLSFDVYVKRLLIEKVIDSMGEVETKKHESKRTKR